MINRILMELYDDYITNKNNQSVIDFAEKTFPKHGTDKLFIGCVMIMFSLANGFKPRYYCTREDLYSIVLLAKEKIGKSNMLAFYIDRVNQSKGINKYLNEIVNDSNLDAYADTIIEYLDQFKPDMISMLKRDKRLDDYMKSIE